MDELSQNIARIRAAVERKLESKPAGTVGDPLTDLKPTQVSSNGSQPFSQATLPDRTDSARDQVVLTVQTLDQRLDSKESTDGYWSSLLRRWGWIEKT